MYKDAIYIFIDIYTENEDINKKILEIAEEKYRFFSGRINMSRQEYVKKTCEQLQQLKSDINNSKKLVKSFPVKGCSYLFNCDKNFFEVYKGD